MIWVVASAKTLLKLYREVLLFSIGAVYGLQECSLTVATGNLEKQFIISDRGKPLFAIARGVWEAALPPPVILTYC